MDDERDNTDTGDFDNEGGPEPPLPRTGSWSRDLFMRQVLERAAEGGNNGAVTHIMSCFPGLSLGNAKLWLAYMQSEEHEEDVVHAYILDSFRNFDWFGTLQGRSAYLFVRASLRFPDIIFAHAASAETCAPGTFG